MTEIHPLFRSPNLLIYSLPRRACSTCGTVGLKPVPFGAGCPNCGAVQVVSGFAVPFQCVPLGRSFYVVGHVSFPYEVWTRVAQLQNGDGSTIHINAVAKQNDQTLVLYLPPTAFIVPVEVALMADRFSFN